MPQWALFAMTLLVMFELVFMSEPANGSPFHSRERIIFNRFLLMLPLIVSCAYLLRPGFRTGLPRTARPVPQLCALIARAAVATTRLMDTGRFCT